MDVCNASQIILYSIKSAIKTLLIAKHTILQLHPARNVLLDIKIDYHNVESFRSSIVWIKLVSNAVHAVKIQSLMITNVI